MIEFILKRYSQFTFQSYTKWQVKEKKKQFRKQGILDILTVKNKVIKTLVNRFLSSLELKCLSVAFLYQLYLSSCKALLHSSVYSIRYRNTLSGHPNLSTTLFRFFKSSLDIRCKSHTTHVLSCLPFYWPFQLSENICDAFF